MTTTTFGYDAKQDRIWMRSHEQNRSVWLSRRLVKHLLGPLLSSFEASAPGGQGGAAAPMRASIEHELAFNEVAPGRQPVKIQAGRVSPVAPGSPELHLCTRLRSNTNDRGVVLQFETDEVPLVLRLSRQGMHVWLRGMVMVLKQAEWNLPTELPAWLSAGMVPAAVKAMLEKPLPTDLDDAAPN